MGCVVCSCQHSFIVPTAPNIECCRVAHFTPSSPPSTMPEAEGLQYALLSSLNAAQRRAVSSPASTVAILAGPGSGKTHTLASRVVWLIEHHGFNPCDIIVATFTAKAAREMKERIDRLLGHVREDKVVLGTFHSIMRRYLVKYGRCIGLDPKFGIADDGDSRAVIQRICKRHKLSCDAAGARAWISRIKAKGALGDVKDKKGQHVEAQDLQKCYEAYQHHLETSKLLDYDDLLLLGVKLLRKNPSCVSNVQAVLIDEYQDTNGIQYDLVKLLAQARSRITVVGDPDQSIYGWRSAEAANLYRLLRDFPGTYEVSLEENYRSSHYILHTALEVIKQDTKRYKKVLVPVRSAGTKPTLRRLASQPVEAEWAVGEIKRVMMLSGGMMNYDDMAILLRSASLSRHLESALGKAGIPYRMVGGFKFYERAEIKILVDYLRVIYQPDNSDALFRVLNVPKRGISDATVKALLEEAETGSTTLWSLLVRHCRGVKTAKTNIRKEAEARVNLQVIRLIESLRESLSASTQEEPFTLVDLVNKLVEKIEFKKYLQDTYSEQHEQRWANVEEFMSLATSFLRELNKQDDETLPDIESLDQPQDTDPLARFLANISLASDVQDSGDQQNKPMVTISTIHAAKGLEWPVVFVPAAYNGSIPHSRSEDTDEERRLLFVAMTRAKALLYLSCPKRALGENTPEFELSSFLDPLTLLFARRGPSFDRKLLEEMGQIIGRPAPKERDIFGDMPLFSGVEDDRFPLDPDAGGVATESTGDPCKFREQESHGWHRAKRQKRCQASLVQTGPVEPPWKTTENTSRVSTTMEAGFTISGFTTAAAHHLALSAAGADLKAQGGTIPPRSLQQQSATRKQRGTTGSTKRHANQASLLGFFKKKKTEFKENYELQEQHRSIVPMTPKPQPGIDFSHPLQTSSRINKQSHPFSTAPALKSPPPPINHDLATHKFGSSRLARPSRVDLTVGEQQHENHQYNTAYKAGLKRHKSYGGCFSSSPPAADAETDKENAAPLAPPQLEHPYHTAGKPPPGSRRGTPPPAGVTCTAKTQCWTKNQPAGLHGAGAGGTRIRRLSSLGMGRRPGGDMKALDKLKKPFKMPTSLKQAGERARVGL